MNNVINWRMSIIQLPRRIKAAIQIVFDLLACSLSTLAVSAAILSQAPSASLDVFQTLVVSVGLFVPIAIGSRFYKMVVRYIGWRSGLRIGLATALYCAGLFVLHFMAPQAISIIYAVAQPILLFLMLLGERAAARYILSYDLTALKAVEKHRYALIYGAGSAGRQLANSLIIDGKICVVGFIDDDVELQGCSVNGLQIRAPREIRALIESREVSDIYLAIPSLSRHKRHTMLTELSVLPVAVRSLPTLAEVINGKVHVSDLRPVQIEEVLGREPVLPDLKLLKQDIADQVVLVTGAGGSIGSELARQALGQNPMVLILFELNEYALYTIEQELLKLIAGGVLSTQIISILGSVTDSALLVRVCNKFGVQTIYHAAAYKHVPLVEQNPLMGIWNNIIGTRRLVEAAKSCEVNTLVLISTDKAVRPTNIMGCTKRIAELILQANQQEFGSESNLKLTMVRFGNVLGSSGSVIPAFKAQIQAGGPVTVTHPEIVRYFMTIPEAAQLVIQAGALGKGGDVMVLDMGEPIKIQDLAERMIHLSGLRVKSGADPDGDIEIVYTGLRPGEKLYEELLIGDNTTSTQHPRICLAREEMIPWEELAPKLNQIETAVQEGDSELARKLLMKLVPEFVPQCENQDFILGAVMHYSVLHCKRCGGRGV